MNHLFTPAAPLMKSVCAVGRPNRRMPPPVSGELRAADSKNLESVFIFVSSACPTHVGATSDQRN
jgi:hypothetical protein